MQRQNEGEGGRGGMCGQQEGKEGLRTKDAGLSVVNANLDCDFAAPTIHEVRVFHVDQHLGLTDLIQPTIDEHRKARLLARHFPHVVGIHCAGKLVHLLAAFCHVVEVALGAAHVLLKRLAGADPDGVGPEGLQRIGHHPVPHIKPRAVVVEVQQELPLHAVRGQLCELGPGKRAPQRPPVGELAVGGVDALPLLVDEQTAEDAVAVRASEVAPAIQQPGCGPEVEQLVGVLLASNDAVAIVLLLVLNVQLLSGLKGAAATAASAAATNKQPPAASVCDVLISLNRTEGQGRGRHHGSITLSQSLPRGQGPVGEAGRRKGGGLEGERERRCTDEAAEHRFIFCSDTRHMQRGGGTSSAK